MPSTRLTNDTRKVIVSRLMAHAFGQREVAIHAEEQALAARAYDHMIPARRQKTMALLPKSYFHTQSALHVYVDGEQHYLTLSEARPVPAESDERRVAIWRIDPLGRDVADFIVRKEALKAEYDTARHEARAIADSATTLEKLVAVWPEIGSFTQDIAKGQKPVTSLAVPIRALNRKLGLPPKAATSKTSKAA